MQLAPELLQQIVDHAVRDKPHECCGIVVTTDGETTVHALENREASGMRFDMDAMEVYRLSNELEDLVAIYHSHPRSAPEPSQTDVNYAKNWPGVEWIIVGLRGPEPKVQSWLIDGSSVTEVPIG